MLKRRPARCSLARVQNAGRGGSLPSSNIIASNAAQTRMKKPRTTNDRGSACQTIWCRYASGIAGSMAPFSAKRKAGNHLLRDSSIRRKCKSNKCVENYFQDRASRATGCPQSGSAQAPALARQSREEGLLPTGRRNYGHRRLTPATPGASLSLEELFQPGRLGTDQSRARTCCGETRT
jgi:hypothetical protein